MMMMIMMIMRVRHSGFDDCQSSSNEVERCRRIVLSKGYEAVRFLVRVNKQEEMTK